MTDLFLKILNMSASASVVILAILGMRLLLRRAPKKWSYLLWSVAAFRLCCPVSLQAAFSLFRLRPIQPTVTQTAGQVTAISYIPQTLTPSVTPSVSTAAQAAAPAAATDPMQYILTAVAVVWCVGIIALLAYSIVSYRKIKNTVLDAVLLRDNIFQSDRIRSPFILGFLRPRIYLPYGMDCERMRYVLAHERCHIRRLDHLIKTFAFALLALHWFNPLCWLAFYLMGKDMEMSCDEQVLGSIEGCRKEYSTTLLSFAAPSHFPAASPLAFGETGVKSRIKNSLNWKKPKSWVTLAAAIVCVVCLAACAVNPVSNTSPAQDITEPSTEQTLAPVETQETVTEPAVNPTKLLNEVLADVADPDVPLCLNYCYDARAVGNAQYYANSLADITYTPTSWNSGTPEGFTIQLELSRNQWLFIYEDNGVELRDGEQIYQFKAGTADAYQLARSWFDETQYYEIYADKIAQGCQTVEDTGQTYLEAALESCEVLEHTYLETIPGSAYRYSYVSCSTEAAEDQTAHFRQQGQIDENTWCFYLTTVFVPENGRALAQSMAGNTKQHFGDIPYMEDPAFEYRRCGYVTKTDSGWQVVIAGTGW